MAIPTSSKSFNGLFLLLLIFVVSLNARVNAQSCDKYCEFCLGFNGIEEQECRNNECWCLCNNGQAFRGGECTYSYSTLAIPAEFLCFSSQVTVTVKKNFAGNSLIQSVPMNELKVGDQVLVENNTYETIYTIDHRHPTKSVEFVQIHYTSSDESNEEGNNDLPPIELTSKHMIFIEGNTNPIPASNVEVGDHLRAINNGDASTLPQYVVTKISSVVRKGLFSPQTPSGTIVVNNGVVASTYSAHLSNNEWIEIAGYQIMTHQNFFMKLLKPYRSMCLGVSLELCKTNDEMIALVKLGQYLLQYSEQMNGMYQATILLLSILIACLLDFIFTPYSIILMASLVGCRFLSVTKGSKKHHIH